MNSTAPFPVDRIEATEPASVSDPRMREQGRMHVITEKRTPPRGFASSAEIRVRGVLDVAKALALAEILARARQPRLRIDLRGVREVHDTALVALARAAGERGAVLVGLTHHHERLLAYVRTVTDSPGVHEGALEKGAET